MNPSLELGYYLNTLSDLYPHGVLVVAPEKLKPLFIVTALEKASQQELLRSIVEKGMKMKIGDVDIVTDSELPQKFSAQHAISFGISLPNITSAPGLTQIATDPESKKKFWAQLKEFLATLN